MLKRALILTACMAVFSAGASAAQIYFLLGDHSDGALYKSTCTPVCDPNAAYGLRLDDFSETFSVGENLGGFGGAMFLTYDPDKLDLGAVIFGNMDSGGVSGDGDNYLVSYLLEGLSPFGNGFKATSGSGGFSETCPVGNLCRDLSLTGVQDDAGYAFYWDNDSFRNPANATWVGRGWVQPGVVHGGGNGTVLVGNAFQNVAFETVATLNGTKLYNDWLVTGAPSPGPGGEEVPEPATISLMIGGLALLIARRKLAKRV